MNDMPPSVASAMPMSSPETDCMMAETMGMLSEMAGSSPRLKRVSGVFNETFVGTHSEEEYPGTSRYSENVWDSPGKNIAMILLFSRWVRSLSGRSGAGEVHTAAWTEPFGESVLDVPL